MLTFGAARSIINTVLKRETKVNKLDVKQKILDFEKEFLESVDLVLPVSEQYKNWVIQQFPSIEKKIHFLNSGISGGGRAML